MTPGVRAAFNRAKSNLNLVACSGLMPDFIPVVKNFSSPLCLKLRIIVRM